MGAARTATGMGLCGVDAARGVPVGRDQKGNRARGRDWVLISSMECILSCGTRFFILDVVVARLLMSKRNHSCHAEDSLQTARDWITTRFRRLVTRGVDFATK